MFVLNHKYEFPPDPARCELNAGIGYGSDVESHLSWGLNLHSATNAIRNSLLDDRKKAESNDKSAGEQVSFGISCGGFTFEVSDWKDLSGTEYEVPADKLGWGFKIEQWEELLALHLKFGAVRENRIEIAAVGEGLVESMQDLFPEGHVQFNVQTWMQFNGVGILVPLNAADPMLYSLARVRALLPEFEFADPQTRETNDENGNLLAIEVLCPPKRH